MSIQSLMAAANAAGYAMAPADETLEEGLEVMPRQFTEEFVDEAEVEVAYAPAQRRALVVHWQDPYYRASWVRDWIASWRFGRATA